MSGSADLVPEFNVSLVQGPFERTIYDVIVKEVTRSSPNGDKIIRSNVLQPRVETFEMGLMVEFPRGHSILVATDDHEQIARLGLLNHPKMINYKAGESELVEEQPLTTKGRRSKEGGLDSI